VRGSCNHFDVNADKVPCVVDEFLDLSVHVCIYIYVCVCVYIYIKSDMDFQPWVRKWIEILVRGSSNHFAVTADKGPCEVNGLAGLGVCVCIYIFLCVCIYIYIYKK
jgi:hypothetical protein